MKTEYIISIDNRWIAKVMLDKVGDTTYEVTEVWVDQDHRRRGHGTHLMRIMCEDADREDITLKLQSSSYGEMTGAQLDDWYRTFGFHGIWYAGPLMRPPKRFWSQTAMEEIRDQHLAEGVVHG